MAEAVRRFESLKPASIAAAAERKLVLCTLKSESKNPAVAHPMRSFDEADDALTNITATLDDVGDRADAILERLLAVHDSEV